MKSKARKAPAATMNPRELLTKKARQAIMVYVAIRVHAPRGSANMSAVVGYVLAAERMTRAALYAYLDDHELVWRHSNWRPRKRRAAPRASKKPIAPGRADRSAPGRAPSRIRNPGEMFRDATYIPTQDQIDAMNPTEIAAWLQAHAGDIRGAQ